MSSYVVVGIGRSKKSNLTLAHNAGGIRVGSTAGLNSGDRRKIDSSSSGGSIKSSHVGMSGVAHRSKMERGDGGNGSKINHQHANHGTTTTTTISTSTSSSISSTSSSSSTGPSTSKKTRQQLGYSLGSSLGSNLSAPRAASTPNPKNMISPSRSTPTPQLKPNATRLVSRIVSPYRTRTPKPTPNTTGSATNTARSLIKSISSAKSSLHKSASESGLKNSGRGGGVSSSHNGVLDALLDNAEDGWGSLDDMNPATLAIIGGNNGKSSSVDVTALALQALARAESEGLRTRPAQIKGNAVVGHSRGHAPL